MAKKARFVKTAGNGFEAVNIDADNSLPHMGEQFEVEENLKKNESQLHSSQASDLAEEDLNLKTIITKDSRIEGLLKTKHRLEVDGEIVGNVSCEKSLTVTGKIIGDILAERINSQGSHLEGNVSIKQDAIIESNSVIVGNLSAEDIEINGTVEGDVKASNSLVILENGQVFGDIITPKIKISEGAVIKGNVKVENFESKHEVSENNITEKQQRDLFAERVNERYLASLEKKDNSDN